MASHVAAARAPEDTTPRFVASGDTSTEEEVSCSIHHSMVISWVDSLKVGTSLVCYNQECLSRSKYKRARAVTVPETWGPCIAAAEADGRTRHPHLAPSSRPPIPLFFLSDTEDAIIGYPDFCILLYKVHCELVYPKKKVEK